MTRFVNQTFTEPVGSDKVTMGQWKDRVGKRQALTCKCGSVNFQNTPPMGWMYDQTATGWWCTKCRTKVE